MHSGTPAYRISKTALNAVTRILADELKEMNIKVNSMCPGWVRTRMGGRGAELAVACRDLALAQFGLLARQVLEHWGITRTEDLGRVVFALVEVGLLVTQPGDREEDFAGVYDFQEAFSDTYAWQGVRRG